MLFDVSDIGRAAITQLQSVSVENLIAFVVLGELLPHKLKKNVRNIKKTVNLLLMR